MGRGKRVKPFIDKKTAATFHLVRRSQRDVQGWNEANSDDDHGVTNTNNEFVLMPSPCNPPKYSQVIVLDRKPSPSMANFTIHRPKEEMTSSSMYWNHVRERLSSHAPQALRDVEAEVYDKFTKPITGEGTFISAKGAAANPPDLTSTENLLMQELSSVLPGQEVERTLESITINPDCMDPEVAAALFGDWDVAKDGEEADGENLFEEILDDFVLTASQEPPAVTEAAEDDVFNYDIHIQQLMERAKCNYDAGNQQEHQWARDDALFFQNYRKHDEDFYEHDDDEEEVDSWDDQIQVSSTFPGVVPALSADEERALRSKFEATLAEYDTNSDYTDEEGEDVYHQDRQVDSAAIHNFPFAMHKQNYSCSTKKEIMDDHDSTGDICTIRTNITTEMQQQHALLEITDQQLDSILNSYLQDREDRRLAEGGTPSFKFKNKISTGGSGYFALQQQGKETGVEEDDEKKEEYYTLDEELAPAPEEILIDGKSYFSEKKISAWDCESILSTYSNLDNNPLVIPRKTSGRRKKASEDKNKNSEMIQLSSKTGLPIVNSFRYDDDVDNESNTVGTSINKGMARKRDESAQEKQARKLAAKKERHAARVQKKIIKQVFKEESRKLNVASGTNELVGQSTFRY